MPARTQNKIIRADIVHLASTVLPDEENVLPIWPMVPALVLPEAQTVEMTSIMLPNMPPFCLFLESADSLFETQGVGLLRTLAAGRLARQGRRGSSSYTLEGLTSPPLIALCTTCICIYIYMYVRIYDIGLLQNILSNSPEIEL